MAWLINDTKSEEKSARSDVKMTNINEGLPKPITLSITYIDILWINLRLTWTSDVACVLFEFSINYMSAT